MKRLKRKRLLSLIEVAELMAKDTPRIAAMTRKRKREYVLRQVRRAERLGGGRISERVGREWYVNELDVDALRKWEPESFTEIERAIADLNAGQTAQQRQINGHGSKLRDHSGRIALLEEKERLTTKFLSDIQALETRKKAAS